MKPYYQHAGITIYHGDCREILPQLPSCDLVLTDPPYGVGESYQSFDDTPENVYRIVSVVVPICISKAKRTLLTCATRQIHMYPPPDWILCWLNRAGAGMNPWGFTCWQPILAYGSDPYLANNMGSRPDIIEHSETSEKNGHPCPKPFAFWKKLLHRGSVKSTDTVIDPMMGSGTTLEAAKDMGLRAIGIEIEEKYCEIAAKRLSQEVLPFERTEPMNSLYALLVLGAVMMTLGCAKPKSQSMKSAATYVEAQRVRSMERSSDERCYAKWLYCDNDSCRPDLHEVECFKVKPQ